MMNRMLSSSTLRRWNSRPRDLWFRPGQMDEEPDYLPPGPRAEPREAEVLDDWRKAKAGHAARLARVAGHARTGVSIGIAERPRHGGTCRSGVSSQERAVVIEIACVKA